MYDAESVPTPSKGHDLGGPIASIAGTDNAGMRLALLGLGLIGGSVVRALRQPRPPQPSDPWTARLEVVAWSPSGTGPRLALAEGLLDRAPASVEGALEGADVVLLAGPPTSVLDWVGALAGPLARHLSPGTVVTDVASTKAAIVERADALGLRFVGGHPMAGREASGFEASSAELFVGRPWVVVPSRAADEAAVALVEGLARSVGAVPVRMTGPEHDRAVAAISHLPLLASVVLVESVLGRPGEPPPAGLEAARRLAASGWRDVTRLARGEPAMAAGIMTTNRVIVAEHLRRLRSVVDEWVALLDDGADEAALAERFAAARTRLEAADLRGGREEGGGEGNPGGRSGRPGREGE